MALTSNTTPHDGSAPRHRYKLYVSGAHLFAHDGSGKSVPIGIIESDKGVLGYSLKVDSLWGDGFLTSEKLLQDVAAKLAYASLHGLFVAAPAAVPGSVPEDASQTLYAEIEEPGEYPPPGSAAE